MALTQQQAQQWAEGYLAYIGAPATSTSDARVSFLAAQAMHENTNAANNPLAIEAGGKTLAGSKVSQYGSVEDGYAALTEYMNSRGVSGYLGALKNPSSTNAQLTSALAAANWEGSATAKAKAASVSYADSVGGLASGASGEVGAVNIPTSTPVPPIQGADVKNFYGYDLSAFTNSPDLGKAEQVVKQYATDPKYKAQLDQNLSTEYGYQTTWWKDIPQVNAIMLYAAQELDPNVASQENEFQGLLSNTQWWQTSTSNARYWDEAYGTNGQPGSDPAQANQALQNAQEKVLADANQIGVTLNKQELDAIALTYAKNNYVASGSFGTASGTAPEWLDQAIIDTITNVQGQKVGNIPTDFYTGAPTVAGTSTPTDFSTMTQGLTNSGSLFGISSQLYAAAQQIAQQYLMYNPNSPTGSLVSNSFLLQQVQDALQNYTGSGSSFGSSNLINGFEQQFTQTMKTMASNFYPSLAPSIAQGTTPASFVQPYTQVISNMLGINPNSIDYTSPEWNWVIATPSSTNGVKTALTLDQVQQKLATTPQFDQSNNAQGMADSVTQNLNRMFGFGGT